MTPEDRSAIVEVIQKTVNGKIDRIEEKLDTHNARHEEDMRDVREHIQDVKPLIDAYNGGKVFGNLVKWVAGVGLAWLAIQGWFTK